MLWLSQFCFSASQTFMYAVTIYCMKTARRCPVLSWGEPVFSSGQNWKVPWPRALLPLNPAAPPVSAAGTVSGLASSIFYLSFMLFFTLFPIFKKSIHILYFGVFCYQIFLRLFSSIFVVLLQRKYPNLHGFLWRCISNFSTNCLWVFQGKK